MARQQRSHVVSPKRRREVKRQTLQYLGELLHAHPDGDTGLYDGLDDEEAAFAIELCRQEGRNLITRAGAKP